MEKKLGTPLLLLILAFLSLIPNISSYEFRMEESRRVLIAWEMLKRGEFFQTYFLGEPYFNKPPLFNWLVLLSSELIGWGEVALRIISVISTLVTSLLTGVLTYLILGNLKLSLLSALAYVSFADILFWYGWLGEIDSTFTLFNLISLLFLYLSFFKSATYMPIAGLFTASAFLLKGLPAYIFFLLSLSALLIYTRRFRLIFTPYALASFLVALLLPVMWLVLTEYPNAYVSKLFAESISRVENSREPLSLIKHLVTYPLLNLKQTLPTSLVLIFVLWKYRAKVYLADNLKPVLLILIFNYLPYLLSAGSRGRYILPLFPLLAVPTAYLIGAKERVYRTFLLIVLITVVLRGMYGFSLGFVDSHRGSAKKVAQHILTVTGDKPLTCDCEDVKSLCLYLSLLGDRYITKSRVNKNWEFNVVCDGNLKDGKLVKSFKLFGKEVRLVSR